MCPKTQSASAKVDKVETRNDVSNENSLASYSALPEVYLQTLRVKMRNGPHELTVHALIDTGSQRSYVTREVAAAMMYEPVDKREVTHTLFGHSKSQPEVHNVYLIRLSSLCNDYHCNFRVMDQRAICGKIPTVQIQSLAGELKSKGIFLTDVGGNSDTMDLLIGADVAAKLYTGRKCDLENGLTAVQTHLGWTVMGKNKDAKADQDVILFTHAEFVDEARICDLWQLDVLGIDDPQHRLSESERNIIVKRRFKETTAFKDDARYEVMLPWISDHSPLSSNKDIALKRLNSVLKKLKDTEIEEYHKVFREWERDDIVERVPDEELENFAHYLPHRPVIKMNSRTTKIRPVFDASAREKNSPSINQCLEKGPNYIELIPSILLGFRRKRIGVIADIKKAFLQIGIIREDRDFLRFYWYHNDVMIVYRHKRVVFGLTCSPFLLGATIDLHLDRISDGHVDTIASRETMEKLRECFYSDNCVASFASIEELRRFKEEATDALRTAGFELRDWQYSGDGGEPIVSVLGLLWDKQEDCLYVNLSLMKDINTENTTKRMMLSVAQRVFDPIGFTCPVMICPKILLQKTWKGNVNWDDEVDDNIRSEFLHWFNDLWSLEKVRIPRRLGEIDDTGKVSVHAFVDASNVAYASVIFIRIEREDSIEVQLIGAITRIAPTKEISIPRLELLAATITARLAESLLNVLNFPDSEVIFWSNSTTVLTWIKREAQWNTFVWNRVQEIRKLSPHVSWRHVPGKMNPADLPSRGCTPSQLCASRWWEGPEWLKMPRDSWPTQDLQVDEEKINREVKKSSITNALLSKCSVNASVYYSRYFSSYSKIIKTVAWVRRFIVNSRIVKAEMQWRHLEPFLSSDELNTAEISLLRIVQNEMFTGEGDNKFKALDVFKDENGLLRVKTRVFNRDDSENFRCPIVLDSTHLIVQRIIEEEHCNLMHAGVQILLCRLREKYWILSARRKIRSVIDKCARCKRYNAKRLESAKTPLPIDRVRDAAVFEVVGVDLARPLYLKGNIKAYVCLFTSAVFRAVHLELLSSLSTTCFVKGLSRFIARRGRPAIIFSDNGTNFVGMENELKKLNWQTIVEYSAVKRIKWNFNPPSAAWWGGWWERIVRIVKQLLRRVLAKASVNYEDMSTILCDCESVINSRPLTYTSNDCSDLVSLTPSVFLQDMRENGTPDLDYLFAIDIKSKVNYLQKLKDCLRKRFRVEYLGYLRETPKASESREINVGDLVLIGDDDSRRIDWPLGKVVAAIKGRDGCVRVCRLRTQNGELVRPVHRLYPLELDCAVDDDFNVTSKESIKCKAPNFGVKLSGESKTVSEVPPATDVGPKSYVTRSGRIVKKVKA